MINENGLCINKLYIQKLNNYFELYNKNEMDKNYWFWISNNHASHILTKVILFVSKKKHYLLMFNIVFVIIDTNFINFYI